MMRRKSIPSGFTFVELLIGMIVLAIVGLSMTGLLRSQTRFFGKQAAASSARSVSRTSLNRVIADIRMVDADSGIVAATNTDITVRVPYALGISCNRSTISLLPVDSAMYSPTAPGGYAWRGSNSYYTYVESGVSVAANATTVCADSSVQVMTADGGKQLTLAPALPASASAKGTIILLIHKVRYQFKASILVPGTIGLYRQQLTPSATEEEIAAPFASDAKFRFFVNNSATAQDAVPASLTTLRGIELNLNALSETLPSGESAKPTSNFTTAVFFHNRRT